MSNPWPLGRYVALSSEEAGTWRKTPFSVVLNRTTWVGATDRKWVLAYPMKNAYAQIPEKDDIRQKLIKLLRQETPTKAAKASLGELREWAGPVASPEEGFATEDQRLAVLVGEVLLDQRRLSCLLASAPVEDTVYFWESTDVLGVRSVTLWMPNRWRAILAGVDGEPGIDHPRFVPPPEQSLSSLLDSLAGD